MPVRDPQITKAEEPQSDPMLKERSANPWFATAVFGVAFFLACLTLYAVTRPPAEPPLVNATAPQAAPPPSAPSTTGQGDQPAR